jgi:hypothetical protein
MPYTIARDQIPTVVAALRSLDGDKNGSFRFGAKARYAIAKNLMVLSRHAEAIEETRIKLIRAISPETYELKPGTPEAKAFTDQFDEFLSEQITAPGVLAVTLEDLDLENNSIPVTTLSVLLKAELIREIPA